MIANINHSTITRFQCSRCGSPDVMSHGYCQKCRKEYRLEYEKRRRRLGVLAKLRLVPQEPIDTDPRKYTARIARLQAIVDRIDTDKGWPRRVIVPTQPGLCPLFVGVGELQ